ncbi:hypothetical protein ATCC90586_003037 [Pythium insidiosum]|nr:hypothetical protein ATCC90586_003037 [Pythium insidiosum]
MTTTGIPSAHDQSACASPSPSGFVCVSCGAAVAQLVRDYGKGNVRLAICGACNAVADPYVEYDNVLLFLEVMLLKPQVYRHVLYNLSPPPRSRAILKLFFILVMLDMNVKAYLIDRRAGVAFRSESMFERDEGREISGLRISQYSLHLVGASFLENVAFVGTLLAAIALDPLARGWRAQLTRGAASRSAALVRFGTAVCVSSFGKLFALLTVIWEFHWTFVHVIGAIVLCSNALALRLLLHEPSPAPAVLLLLLAALAARAATQLALYYFVGDSALFFVLV